jgi:hypothetical protein
MIITALQNRKYWKNALLTISMLLLVLGFTPWDRWFSLDTDNELLSWLIDPLAGLLGLAIAIAISAHYINKSKNRYAVLIVILLRILLIPIALLETVALILPDYRWHDKEVYKNSNDYIVIQEFENFVTNSDVYPRMLLTKSPYNIIRRIEGTHDTLHDYRFGSDYLRYKGRIWRKVSSVN